MTKTESVVAANGAVIPVIVKDICEVDVILFILITCELMDVHDHVVQLSVEGTVNPLGIVTSR